MCGLWNVRSGFAGEWEDNFLLHGARDASVERGGGGHGKRPCRAGQESGQLLSTNKAETIFGGYKSGWGEATSRPGLLCVSMALAEQEKQL